MCTATTPESGGITQILESWPCTFSCRFKSRFSLLRPRTGQSFTEAVRVMYTFIHTVMRPLRAEIQEFTHPTRYTENCVKYPQEP
ncbi:hypothetical protein EDD25_3239 [Cryobacterium psychrophilum]|nr:hypothetical protein EDD25_3239 [Cryobacterium psychrophilum]